MNSELMKLVEKWRKEKVANDWPGAEYFNDARNACAYELEALAAEQPQVTLSKEQVRGVLHACEGKVVGYYSLVTQALNDCLAPFAPQCTCAPETGKRDPDCKVCSLPAEPAPTWTCPDYGYDSMPYPPKDYNICPKCKVEFGTDDKTTLAAGPTSDVDLVKKLTQVIRKWNFMACSDADGLEDEIRATAAAWLPAHDAKVADKAVRDFIGSSQSLQEHDAKVRKDALVEMEKFVAGLCNHGDVNAAAIRAYRALSQPGPNGGGK